MSKSIWPWILGIGIATGIGTFGGYEWGKTVEHKQGEKEYAKKYQEMSELVSENNRYQTARNDSIISEKNAIIARKEAILLNTVKEIASWTEDLKVVDERIIGLQKALKDCENERDSSKN